MISAHRPVRPSASRSIREYHPVLQGGEPPLTPEGSKGAKKVAQDPTAKNRSGSEVRKRPRQTLVRWDGDEFEIVDGRAAAKRLTVPSWLRELALEEAARHTRPTRRAGADRQLLAKILGQLGKIGSNLNQITRRANIDPGERAEIGATHAQLRAMLPLILEALGSKP